MGAGGSSRAGVAPARWHADPPDRPGHRTRNVQPAPSRAPRRHGRAAVHADPAPVRRASLIRAARQPPLGAGLPRVRVRLCGRGTGDARPVGGAVRGLCQRRRGRDRPVHHRRAGQVGRDLAADPAPAARLRRPGTGALERPPRALPGPRRRRQRAGGELHDARPVLSTCCAIRRCARSSGRWC